MNLTKPTWRIVLPFLGIACGGGGPEDSDPVTEPTPYIFEDEGESAPEVDVAAVGAEVEDILGQIFSLNAGPPVSAYRKLAASQTTTCPRTYANDGNLYWFDNCTTDDGTHFSGYGFYYDYRAYPLGDGWLGDTQVLSGAASISGTTSIDVAGTANLTSATHSVNPAKAWISEVRGTFGSDDPEYAGTWLGTGLSPDLRMTVLEQTVVSGRSIQFEGGVSGMDGAVVALVMDRVSLIEGALGGPCEREPHGILSARLADGTWVDLVFDGPNPDTLQMDPAKCDGKGRMYWRGEELGQVDLDFSFLFDFTGAPW